MNKKYLKEENVSILLGLFALIMLALAVAGGRQGYSPVPYWDMWNGTLGFVLDALEGKPGVWFEQHNEHRIVLSRLLFWVDYHVFGGRSAFLILMNFVIVVAVCFVFALFIKRLHPQKQDGLPAAAVLFFVCGWQFFWAQQENFTWAFQSQFFLAQMLPLASMYCLARAADTGRGRDFLASLLLGVLSAGTMANGIMALPLMFVMSCFIRLSTVKRLMLLLAAMAVPALYFWNYVSPPGHGSIKSAILEHPVALVEYTFRYLGSPFYFLFGERVFAYYFSLWGGVAMALIVLFLAWRSVRQTGRSPYIVALLVFIVYIAGTAFGTGGGRVIFGTSQAMSGRYTTPAIMGWAALFLAVLYFAPQAMLPRRTLLGGCMLALSVHMMIYQFEVFSETGGVPFNRTTAGLAIELQIQDDEMLKSVFPVPDLPMQLDEKARASGVSPLDFYPYAGLRQQLGQTITITGSHDCIGSLDGSDEVAPDSDYIRLRGWIFSVAEKASPAVLRLVSPEGRIIGFALSGAPRPDVAAAVHSNAKNSGFYGYVEKAALNGGVVALGDGPQCALLLSAG